ncbi:MAG: HU family DNA-binding protein [Planctomycetia bacterium]|nr:HU family DNA-binding protein [Planctomycetia bacterium]
MSITKKDIVHTISEEVDVPQQKVKEIVQKTFDAIIEILGTDEKIELRNFGVFKVKTRAARPARNPKTGEEVWLDERNVITFKPGKKMIELIQKKRKKKNSKKK